MKRVIPATTKARRSSVPVSPFEFESFEARVRLAARHSPLPVGVSFRRMNIHRHAILTGEVKYLHMSCGGIDKPNRGLNDIIGMIGLTWFFGK